jgi:hypothetical protein
VVRAGSSVGVAAHLLRGAVARATIEASCRHHVR